MKNYELRIQLSHIMTLRLPCLALQQAAENANGKPVTVDYNGSAINVVDASQIPVGLEGYVQVALNLNLINVRFALEQGPYDLVPVLKAYFDPNKKITRADFAVFITRTHIQWQNAESTEAATASGAGADASSAETYSISGFPNPFKNSTTISYVLENDTMVDLSVFDAMGNKVVTLVSEPQKRGSHTAAFQMPGSRPGVYVAKIRTAQFSKTLRILAE